MCFESFNMKYATHILKMILSLNSTFQVLYSNLILNLVEGFCAYSVLHTSPASEMYPSTVDQEMNQSMEAGLGNDTGFLLIVFNVPVMEITGR